MPLTTLSHDDLHAQLDALCTILIDTVANGAAVSFLHPLPEQQARAFWTDEIAPHVASGSRTLFGATHNNCLVGTVQLITAMPPNQPHRAEIAKMMVHPSARRVGLGRALVIHALDTARAKGKTLVTLDTRTGDLAQPLYASVGFEEAGVIPDFAFDPDGQNMHATTYMYMRL